MTTTLRNVAAIIGSMACVMATFAAIQDEPEFAQRDPVSTTRPSAAREVRDAPAPPLAPRAAVTQLREANSQLASPEPTLVPSVAIPTPGFANPARVPQQTHGFFAQPQRFDRYPQNITVMATPSNDPTQRLAADILNADDEDTRKEKLAELKEELEGRFDSGLEVQENELKQLEDRVAKLREAVDTRKENRDRIIENYLDSIRLQAEGLTIPGVNGLPGRAAAGFGTARSFQRQMPPVATIPNPPTTSFVPRTVAPVRATFPEAPRLPASRSVPSVRRTGR